MKVLLPPKWKFYAFLFAIPLFGIVINLVLFDNRLWTEPRLWFYSLPIIFIAGYFSWYVQLLYDELVESRYPGLPESKLRIMHRALGLLFVMIPITTMLFFVYHFFHLFGYNFNTIDLAKGIAVSLSMHLIWESLYEGDYLFGRYKESREENKTMQQLAVIHEFNTLKNQVNPHFLFNCFNTLSSLISVDKKNAELFLNELSKVYRYLLRINEEGLSTVKSEINFINSYYKLLQTRHGDAVKLNIQIYKGYDSYVLPSLTLQLLVENVVKHNVLSKNKPLVIDIFTTAGNKLVVNNNLQRRSVKAPSNKVGLENIRAKYDLLRQDGFQVMEDEKNFTVVLPLIWRKSQVGFKTA